MCRTRYSQYNFDYKREKAEEWWHTSNLTKVKCYSPAGDMRLAPAHLAGSAHHPGGRLRGLKIVGAYVGDDDWCSAMLVKALTRKLKPLDMVEQIVDGEHVKNAEQLQRYLLVRAAATIPSYWFQLMRPEVTEAAAIYCKARFTQVVESMYNFEGSPADRASLARRQCFLSADLGGIQLPDFPLARFADYASASYATWRTTIAHVTALAASDLSADPSTLATLPAAFASSYRRCISAHEVVVDAYRSADSKRHFLTVGGSRTYHRPRRYVLSRRFPTLDALFADRSAGTIIHPSKKALMQAIDNETYLGWWGDVVDFDANNTGAEIRNR